MAVDGYLNFNTKIDSTGFNKGTKSIGSGISGLKSSFLKLGAAVGAAFGAAKIVEFGKESSKIALSAEANIMRVRDIFGQYSQTITDFAKSNGNALGMSQSSMQQYAATYGNLFSTFSDNQQDNANMTKQYLNATAVVASKTGRTVDDVAERIRSGLLGNTEAIEDLGINVNIKTIEITDAFKRIANGRSWDQLNAYEQAQVRQLAILEQATGKYGTTVANNGVFATQRAAAAIENLKNTIGTLLNKAIIPAIEWFANFVNGINSIFTAIFGEQTQGQEQVTKQTKQSANAQKDLAKQTTAAGKAASKSTASFDELNALSQNNTGSSNSGNSSGNSQSIANSNAEIPTPDSSRFTKIADEIKRAFNQIMNHPIVKWIRGKFADAIKFSIERIDSFKKWLDSLKDTFEQIKSKLQEATDKIWEFWEPIADTAWEEYKNIMVDIDNAFQNIIGTAARLYNKFLDLWLAIQKLLDGIGALKMWQKQFQNIIIFISGIVHVFAEWIGEKCKEIELKFGGLMDFLTGVFSGDWQKALDGLKDVFKGFKTGIEADTNLFKGIFEKIGGFLKDTWNNAKEFLKKVLENIGQFFKELPGNIGYLLGRATAKIIEWGANMIQWAKTKPKEIIDNIVKFFKDLPGKIKDIWNDIITFLNKIPGKMLNLGSNLLRGIWNGILSAKKWFCDTISKFFGGFLDGLFDGLNWGKGSPSNISPIPKLATGTYVPANYGEFLAVLGDNKREAEVVSPISAMKQAFMEAMAENGNYKGNGPIRITINVSRQKLAEIVSDGINENTRQTGELAIDLI